MYIYTVRISRTNLCINVRILAVHMYMRVYIYIYKHVTAVHTYIHTYILTFPANGCVLH